MNHTRALSSDKTSDATTTGLPNAGSRLQVSNSALRFDQTSPGEESFLTLRITPPKPNTLVVVSVDDVSLFQVAIGVERLAFKQTLTFKPEATGSYVHLRYTPERSGRHQSTLTVEVPTTAEIVQIPLSGRTSGIGLPVLSGGTAVKRPMSALTRSLLVGGLLLGIGFAGYTYRCQIWPATCGPSFGTPVPTVTEDSAPKQLEVNTSRSTEPLPLSPEPEATASPAKNRSVVRATERTQTSERPTEIVVRRPTPKAAVPEQKATPASDGTTRTSGRAVANAPEQRTTPPVISENVVRKPASTAKPTTTQRTQSAATPPAPKPAAKPNPSEESELERVLNREPN